MQVLFRNYMSNKIALLERVEKYKASKKDTQKLFGIFSCPQ